MYKYETHLHTYPVSRCAKAGVRETLEFYKSQGYDGVFITNHFLDGNINISSFEPYEKKLQFYFSDYENGLDISDEIGIKVFFGVEMSYHGTDFLIYGLDKQWFFDNPQIMKMNVREKLSFIMSSGGYAVQAHPYREAGYIDHIRLYPRSVNAVEVINGANSELANKMALQYAESYELAMTAGSDNHAGKNAHTLAGVMTDTPLNCVEDYIENLKNGKIKIFCEKS